MKHLLTTAALLLLGVLCARANSVSWALQSHARIYSSVFDETDLQDGDTPGFVFTSTTSAFANGGLETSSRSHSSATLTSSSTPTENAYTIETSWRPTWWVVEGDLPVSATGSFEIVYTLELAEDSYFTLTPPTSTTDLSLRIGHRLLIETVPGGQGIAADAYTPHFLAAGTYEYTITALAGYGYEGFPPSGSESMDITATISTVPEPASCALLALSCLTLGYLASHRRKNPRP